MNWDAIEVYLRGTEDLSSINLCALNSLSYRLRISVFTASTV